MLQSFAIWVFSIAVFDAFIYLYSRSAASSGGAPSYYYYIFVFTALIGTLSWGYFYDSVDKSIRRNRNAAKGIVLSALFAVFSLAVGFALIVAALLLSFRGTNIPEAVRIITKKDSPAKTVILEMPLKSGDSGDDVVVLQAALKTEPEIYPLGIVSGYFGSLTKKAVANFQDKYGLEQTGEADGKTLDKFNEVYKGLSRGKLLLQKQVFTDETGSEPAGNSAGYTGDNYTMKANPDKPGFFTLENVPPEKMATVEELNAAMNTYRRSHSLNELNNNSKLCEYAAVRAREIVSDFSHDGFSKHAGNGDYNESGFNSFGENIFSGYFSSVHIIEYAWDRSEGHQRNQQSDWNSGCAGVYEKYVAFIFAK